MKNKQDLVNDAFNYAINFYSNNDRHLDNQFKCLHEMMRITGLDDITCVKIQDPILFVLRAQNTINIGNEAIQNLHRIVSDNLRNHMSELGVQNFQHIPTSTVDKFTGTKPTIEARYAALQKGFTGQVLGGAVHDDRHKREYSEKPQVNKEMLASARGIDSKNNAKAVNFVLFHDCYLNDDDMYWLSATFNTHTPKGLAVNTVDLSNNSLTLVRDPNLTYVDLPFFSFNSPYNTPRNILRLDLSNNQIGDAGAKVVADGLANGVFPITKQINLSGNKITDTGKGFIANIMHKLNQGLVVTLETIQNASKETFKIGIKAMLSISKSNGISTKEALTTEETIEHCKKGIPNVGYNLSWGVIKCFTGADTPIALYQKDVHSLVVKTTVNVINPLKKPMQFVCMTQETVFSVVDEEFANCLTGVDSGLND